MNVLGADDGGEGNLTYTWTVVSAPSGSNPQFGDSNGANDGKQTGVTFDRAGQYAFDVSIGDAHGLTTDGGTVSVTVVQTLSGIVVDPTAAAISMGQSEQLNATGIDQFGNHMTTPPTFTWAVASGPGTISSSGLLTTPTTGGDATSTINASAGGFTATANIAVQGKFVINFNELNEGDIVSDQYTSSTGVTFSSDTGSITVLTSAKGIGFPITDTGPQDLTIDFATPADNLKFTSGEESITLHIYRNGQLIGTETAGGPIDLSAYSGITQLQISGFYSQDQNTGTDSSSSSSGTPILDDFSFNPSSLLSLTVASDADSTNHATAIVGNNGKLYIAADTSGVATVDVESLFAGSGLNANGSAKYRLVVTRSDGMVVVNGGMTGFNQSSQITLPVTNTARDFTIDVFADYNGNGQFDAGEERREVDVHVYSLGIRTDFNGDGVVDSTDDASCRPIPNANRRGRNCESDGSGSDGNAGRCQPKRVGRSDGRPESYAGSE